MKKKILFVGLFSALGGTLWAEQPLQKNTSLLPTLDETDNDMSEEEVAAFAAYVPETVSPLRNWCNAQITTLVLWGFRCSYYCGQCMDTFSFWKSKKRKKRDRAKRSRRARAVAS